MITIGGFYAYAMGNAGSNPSGGGAGPVMLPEERVTAITSLVIELFTAVYEKSIGIAMFKAQVKADAGPVVPDPDWIQPPVPEMPLMSGWMQKLGEKSSSWKRRCGLHFFMCRHAAFRQAKALIIIFIIYICHF